MVKLAHGPGHRGYLDMAASQSEYKRAQLRGDGLLITYR